MKRLQIVGWALIALGLLMSFIPWDGSASVWTATAYDNGGYRWTPFEPYAVYSNLVGVILLLLLVVAGTAVLVLAKTYKTSSEGAVRHPTASPLGDPRWQTNDRRGSSRGS